MDTDTKKIISDQLERIPKALKDAILSVDYADKLQAITKDNKLMIDQAGQLETETTLVMLGLEPLDDYMDNLQKNAGLSKNQAIAISHDVNELIFKNIREALKKINEAGQAEAPAAKSIWQRTDTPSREEILSDIENPDDIKTKEGSVSISSLPSNNPKPADEKNMIGNNIEIRNDLVPEIHPAAILPVKSAFAKTEVPYHENISPVENIVKAKMTEVVALPKETIVVEEKAKLPEKSQPSSGGDPYREPII